MQMLASRARGRSGRRRRTSSWEEFAGIAGRLYPAGRSYTTLEMVLVLRITLLRRVNLPTSTPKLMAVVNNREPISYHVLPPWYGCEI